MTDKTSFEVNDAFESNETMNNDIDSAATVGTADPASAEDSTAPAEESTVPAVKKAGFATIIGRPNVGKSTLMNRMIGQKIAITSYKPQTTRTKICTIYTGDEGQIVFLDTPGIHQSRTKLGAYMVKAAKGTLKEVDVILWLVEPGERIGNNEQEIAKKLTDSEKPVILIINKQDIHEDSFPLI